MLPIRNIAISVNYVNGIILSEEYEVQGNGWYERYREDTIVNLSESYTIHNKHCKRNKLFK